MRKTKLARDPLIENFTPGQNLASRWCQFPYKVLGALLSCSRSGRLRVHMLKVTRSQNIMIVTSKLEACTCTLYHELVHCSREKIILQGL